MTYMPKPNQIISEEIHVITIIQAILFPIFIYLTKKNKDCKLYLTL